MATPEEDAAAPTLFPVALRKLRPIAIDAARALNDILGQLEDSKGYARLTLEVANGELRFVDIDRRFKVYSER